MLTAALLLGLGSSLHCVAMCGPLVLCLPRGPRPAATLGLRLLYQAGRVATYSLLGLLAGSIGAGFGAFLPQQPLAIGLGLLMIGGVFFYKPLEKGAARSAFLQRIQARGRQLFGQKDPGTLWAAGMLNGLLPCGMVYMALLGAASLAQPLAGMSFMALFGLGTLPALLSLSLGSSLLLRWKDFWQYVRPALLVLAGALLVLRGLGLGIPLVSPELPGPQQPVAEIRCQP